MQIFSCISKSTLLVALDSIRMQNKKFEEDDTNSLRMLWMLLHPSTLSCNVDFSVLLFKLKILV